MSTKLEGREDMSWGPGGYFVATFLLAALGIILLVTSGRETHTELYNGYRARVQVDRELRMVTVSGAIGGLRVYEENGELKTVQTVVPGKRPPLFLYGVGEPSSEAVALWHRYFDLE